jgi:hypothetical protein
MFRTQDYAKRSAGAGKKNIGADMEMYGKHDFPGRVVVEGIDGSGESTQLNGGPR